MVGRELHTLVCPLGEDHQGQGDPAWGGMGYRMEPGCRSWVTAMKTSFRPAVYVAKGACFSIRWCRRGDQEEPLPVMHCTTTALIQDGMQGEELITIMQFIGRPLKTTTMVSALIQTRKSSSSNALSTAYASPARAANPTSTSRTRSSRRLRVRTSSNLPSRRTSLPHGPPPRAAQAAAATTTAAPARRSPARGLRSSPPRHARRDPARESRTAIVATAPLMSLKPRLLHHQACAFPVRVPLHWAMRPIRLLTPVLAVLAEPTMPPPSGGNGQTLSTILPLATMQDPAAGTQSDSLPPRKQSTSPVAPTARAQARVRQAIRRRRRIRPMGLSASAGGHPTLILSCTRRAALRPGCTRAAAHLQAQAASVAPCLALLLPCRQPEKVSRTPRFRAAYPSPREPSLRQAAHA